MLNSMSSSVKRKLTWMNILASSATMLLACGAFMVYERMTFRDSLIRNLSTNAKIIADNTATALLFNDPRAATATLLGFKAEPNIVSIQIVHNDGRVFAQYQRPDAVEFPVFLHVAERAAGHQFSKGRLVLFHPIFSEKSEIGMVYLQSDLGEMEARVRRYALIVVGVLFFSLLTGAALSFRLQRNISGPILELVKKAKIVSVERNYSIRVEQERSDELGLLGKSFNEMLTQIEQRDLDLRTAHDDLERRVEMRTHELQLEVAQRRALQEKLGEQNEELESQNKQVRMANRLKSEFLANMSHELRTPLNAIIGFSEMMQDERAGPIPTTQKLHLGYVLSSARHLLQLINDVLDLSKIEAGKMELRPESVDLRSLVGEALDTLREMAAKKRISISTEIDHRLETVTVDPAKLKQVLYNYLSNALKFTPDEGWVAIRLRAEGNDRFRLEVEDSGIGICEDDLPRLFGEFQQIYSGSARKYLGTGLGLALTKRIVEAQGGTVGAHSVLGRGSTFFTILPRTTAGRPAQAASSSPGPLLPPQLSLEGSDAR